MVGDPKFWNSFADASTTQHITISAEILNVKIDIPKCHISSPMSFLSSVGRGRKIIIILVGQLITYYLLHRFNFMREKVWSC